jgi:hypothetical protein
MRRVSAVRPGRGGGGTQGLFDFSDTLEFGRPAPERGEKENARALPLVQS